jgi:hypothetical protein
MNRITITTCPNYVESPLSFVLAYLPINELPFIPQIGDTIQLTKKDMSVCNLPPEHVLNTLDFDNDLLTISKFNQYRYIEFVKVVDRIINNDRSITLSVEPIA